MLPLLLLLIHFFYSCCSNRASKPASGTPVTACPCLSHACLCVWGVCGVCGFVYLLSDLLTCCGLTHLQLALQRPESNHLNCNEMHDQRHHVEQIVAGHYAQLPHDRVGFPVGEGRCEREMRKDILQPPIAMIYGGTVTWRERSALLRQAAAS